MNSFKKKLISKKLNAEINIKNGVVTVDPVSCDGCGDCVDVCPKDAIKMIMLSDDEVKKMPFKGRLKVFVKGKNKALIDPELCIACSICMKECHEFAIHKSEK